MATKREVAIGKIIEDRSMQARERMDMDAVGDYALAYAQGAALPPVLLVERDDGSLLLVDGWHRVAAARSAKMKTIEALVLRGDDAEARWQAARANIGHGLRRTNEDKRRAVALAIEAKPDASLREIADWVGVSHTMVRRSEEPAAKAAAVKAKVARRVKRAKDADAEADEVALAMEAADEAIRECIGEVEAARQAVRGLCDSPHGVFIHAQAVQTDIKNAISALRQALPDGRCPVCGGDGCATCRMVGWVSAQQSALIPASQRKAGA